MSDSSRVMRASAARRAPALLALLLGLGPALPAAAQSCTEPTFFAGLPIPTDPLALDVAAGDWNGDGHTDVAISTDSGTVSIRLGDGKGGFGGTANVAVGASPVAIVAGDFDGDGRLDLATANRGSDSISFLQGDGAGGFALVRTVASIAAPRDLASGDFDRDGDLDLAVAASGSDRVVILDNRGGFDFAAAAQVLTVEQTPTAVAAGDFDRDGDLDLVAANSGSDSVSVLLGDGAGGFSVQPRTPLAGADEPLHLTLVDLDRDGVLDLATANNLTRDLTLLKGQGDGTFAVAVAALPLPGSFGGQHVTWGDFDRDGRPDLAASSYSHEVFFLGDGAFGFSPPTTAFFGAGVRAAVVADFEEDGRPDLVLAVFTGSGEGALLKNGTGVACPNASFGAAQAFGTGDTPYWPAAGDFDGDGRLDLAVSNVISNTVSVLLATGPGTFGPASNHGVGAFPVQVATADFNADGLLDIVVANEFSSSVSLLRGTGGGAFAAQAVFPVGASPVALAVGDFDDDGRPDLAVANSGSNTVSILLNDGAGFAAAVDVGAGVGPTGVAAGDLDGDGRLDLAVSNGNALPPNQVVFLAGDGTGGFSLAGTVPTGGVQTYAVVLGDLDGDLDLDVATANRDSNDVTVLQNDGSFAFSPAGVLPVGSSPRAIAVGDFNGDGDPDLATANTTSSDASVLLGSLGATFVPAPASPLNGLNNPLGILAADITRDGQDDLVAGTGGADAVTLLVGDGAGGFRTTPFTDVTAFARSVTAADFTRDGSPDVAVLHAATTDAITLLPGTGSGGFGPSILSSILGSKLVEAAAGDLDRDGILDLVAIDSGNLVRTLRGDGAGRFSPFPSPPQDATSGPSSVAVADFDRDGRLDVVVSCRDTDQVWVYQGDGLGGIVLRAPLLAGDEPVGVTVGDFDRDGLVDVASANYRSGDVSVFLNQGGFLFGGATVLTTSLPNAIATVDWDGDGDLDLATAGEGSGDVAILLNLGAGVFVGAFSFPAGQKPFALVFDDFNRDGVPDAATANVTQATVSVLTGIAGGGFNLPAVGYAVNGSAEDLAAADFDRDGRPDLVTADSISSTVSLLLDTNCGRRRMDLVSQPLACNTRDVAFSSQPRLRLYDDGGNLVQCDGGTVVASRVAGPAATLNGPASVTFSSGGASYAGLSLDTDGVGYVLGFTHSHPDGMTAIPARTRPFTVGLAASIAGPTEVCLGTPATFDGGSGFERYAWTFDGSAAGLSRFLTVDPPAGNHTVELQATLSGCTVTGSRSLAVATAPTAWLSVAGSTVVCAGAGCTGGTATASATGGGTFTYRWGFRIPPDPTVIFIPGETGSSYLIQGSHFPGPGVYELVAEVTSVACGLADLSDPVRVTVSTVEASGPEVRFFTATSRSQENVLEWVNPDTPPFQEVLIRYNTAATAPLCAPPADPTLGTQLAFVAGALDARQSYTHSGLADGTTYCYGMFVHQGSGAFSPGIRSVRTRPFDSTGAVKWAFSTGMTALESPGLGPNAIHIVNQDNALHAAAKGPSGGTWPSGWRPAPLNMPAHGRPSTVPVPFLGASRVIFLSSEDGNLYAIDADSGQTLVTAALGALSLAPPAAAYTAFGGVQNVVVAGTGEPLVANTLSAFDPGAGVAGFATPVWDYSGDVASGEIGRIAGQAAVDYPSNRVYFDSYQRAPSNNTIWCLDLATGTPCWPTATGTGANAVTAMTLRGNRLYVGTDDGQVVALQTSDGTVAASRNFGDGPVKAFIMADRLTSDLYFATTGRVWSVADDGPPGFRDRWSALVANPSAPVYPPATEFLYVGASGGQLVRLRAADGMPGPTSSLGDGTAILGSPTLDVRQGFLYVGSEAGVVYCVQLP